MPRTYESVSVLDVYHVGPLPDPDLQNPVGVAADNKAVGVWIADNVLVVEAFLTVGRTVVFGSDIQDICVLGWPIYAAPAPINAPALPFRPFGYTITKPDGTAHYVWQNALGPWPGCDSLVFTELLILSSIIS
jgi:hypothetical protein